MLATRGAAVIVSRTNDGGVCRAFKKIYIFRFVFSTFFFLVVKEKEITKVEIKNRENVKGEKKDRKRKKLEEEEESNKKDDDF